MADIRLDGNGDVYLRADGNIALSDSSCCETCSYCLGGSNNAPTAFKVVVTGIEGEDKCLDAGGTDYCDQYNATYCLVKTGACEWMYNGFDNHCSFPQDPSKKILLTAGISGTTYYVRVQYIFGGSSGAMQAIVWSNYYGSVNKPDCDGFSSLELDGAFDPSGVVHKCDASGAECRITAL